MTDRAFIEPTHDPDLIILVVGVPGAAGGWVGLERLPFARADLNARAVERALRDVGWSKARACGGACRLMRAYRGIDSFRSLEHAR